MSKILEKIIIRRIETIITGKKLIPNHEFVFRNKHATIKQAYRVVNKIITSLENIMYCTAAFPDVEKAFDRIWRKGLLYKIAKNFPPSYYNLLKSYLSNRTYFVKVQDEFSNIFHINAGVLHGSVLGPILYTIFTVDIPTTQETHLETFVDDMSILACQEHATAAFKML